MGCSQEEGKGGCRWRVATAWGFWGSWRGSAKVDLTGKRGYRRMGLGCQGRKGEGISLWIRIRFRVREKMDYIGSDNGFGFVGKGLKGYRHDTNNVAS